MARNTFITVFYEVIGIANVSIGLLRLVRLVSSHNTTESLEWERLDIIDPVVHFVANEQS